MGSLVLVEFVTLDGVMQGLGSPDEDRDGGFEYGGWSAPYMDEAQFRSSVDSMSATTAYLLGRRTYEKMIDFWPHQGDDNPMAKALNAAPKYVATRTLTDLTWNATVLDGPLEAAVADLKARHDGEIVVLGSWALVEQLIAAGLVDGYRLFLHPLVLGTGKRLFRPVPEPLRLTLLDATPTSTGVVMLNYAAA
jgi:dihydrofolate reductase